MRALAHCHIAPGISNSIVRPQICTVSEFQLLMDMDSGSATAIGQRIKRIGAEVRRPIDHGGRQDFARLPPRRGVADVHLRQLETSLAGFLQCCCSEDAVRSDEQDRTTGIDYAGLRVFKGLTIGTLFEAVIIHFDDFVCLATAIIWLR